MVKVKFTPAIKAGLVAQLFAAAFPVMAEDTTEVKEKEDQMVVTASAVEQNLKDAPASISVITREDLQKKPVQNLKDVLKDVPGVQITNESDNRQGVSIRGLGSGYTLILVDGKRVNSRNAVFRHNDFDLSWIPPNPSSALKWCAGRCPRCMAPTRWAASSTSLPVKSAKPGTER